MCQYRKLLGELASWSNLIERESEEESLIFCGSQKCYRPDRSKQLVDFFFLCLTENVRPKLWEQFSSPAVEEGHFPRNGLDQMMDTLQGLFYSGVFVSKKEKEAFTFPIFPGWGLWKGYPLLWRTSSSIGTAKNSLGHCKMKRRPLFS